MKTDTKLKDFEMKLMEEETNRMKLENDLQEKILALQKQEEETRSLQEKVQRITIEKDEVAKQKTMALRKLESSQQLVKKIKETSNLKSSKSTIKHQMGPKPERRDSRVVIPILSKENRRISQQFNFPEFMETHKRGHDMNVSNVSIIAELNENIILKSGLLTIQEEDPIKRKKTWALRWFVVKENGLSYYDKTKHHELLGKIDLSNCEVKRADSTTQKLNSFILTCHNQSQHFLYANDEETCESWISFLSELN